MDERPLDITYHFVFDGDPPAEKRCVVRLDPVSLETAHRLDPPPPAWTQLQVEQCSVCPLKANESPYCPAALSFVEIMDDFGDLLSYAEVHVTVQTRERTVTLTCAIQKALSSLVGLRMATCGCPILAKFKPMARFHLPFASTEETVFRSVSAYLLAQYFMRQRGHAADLDLDGLRAMYDLIHEVNVGLANRLRVIPSGDAHLNAIVILDLLTHALPYSIEDKLVTIEHLFAPFLTDDQDGA
ncbi:MAG: hypothetical protein IT365_10080 [Candidatus Hydrogenedentes bacterium]|nr:hypothetical protein [Candidatus Hydrogenedentota bacterium]